MQAQVWQVGNTYQSVATTLAGITDLLTHHTARDDVEITLAEALNNYVDHAQDPCGQAQLYIQTNSAGMINCALIDTGRPYDPPQTSELGQAKTHGHGWVIMRGLTKSITYSRDKGRNTLQLAF